LDLVFFQIAVLLYILASAGYLIFLILLTDSRAFIGSIPAVAGYAAHTLSILHRAIFSGFFPLATMFDALSFFAWLVMGPALLFALRSRDPSPIPVSLATPFVTVILIAAYTISYQIKMPLVPILRSWWLPIHVSFAIAGNGMFALMAIGGIMYILQERLIKRKRLGRIHKLLPSLETLDMINRRGLPIGFFLLTLGIISGALWANSAWGQFWSWDPKETWSLITWFAYAGMIHQRLALGWRGKKAAILAILGFMLVMFTFLGVSALLGGHHAFSMPRLVSWNGLP
jgi:cytochrome c-type biogenesis protein CcsB